MLGDMIFPGVPESRRVRSSPRAAADCAPKAAEFAYNDKGSMATISRFPGRREDGQQEADRLRRMVAWCFPHLLYIVGFKSQVGTLSASPKVLLAFRPHAAHDHQPAVGGRLALEQLGAGARQSSSSVKTPVREQRTGRASHALLTANTSRKLLLLAPSCCVAPLPKQDFARMYTALMGKVMQRCRLVDNHAEIATQTIWLCPSRWYVEGGEAELCKLLNDIRRPPGDPNVEMIRSLHSVKAHRVRSDRS